jgi:hypothetical protein
MDIETCRHPACSCAVTDGRFCSPHCESASTDVETHSTCECGHEACTH